MKALWMSTWAVSRLGGSEMAVAGPAYSPRRLEMAQIAGMLLGLHRHLLGVEVVF